MPLLNYSASFASLKFGSAAKGAQANSTVTSAAIVSSLVFIVVGPFSSLEDGDDRTVWQHDVLSNYREDRSP
jgi:hypothetical protein